LHVQGQNQDQATLLPERLDDLIGDGNAVRLIDAFVDSLDLKAPGFARIETKGTGRPPYHPGDLLKLYLYGYMYRVRSCRELRISEQSYYRWRKKYGGMQVSQAKKLKDLERENARLKKLVAEQALDKAILEEALKGKY
jgi:transposase